MSKSLYHLQYSKYLNTYRQLKRLPKKIPKFVHQIGGSNLNQQMIGQMESLYGDSFTLKYDVSTDFIQDIQQQIIKLTKTELDPDKCKQTIVKNYLPRIINKINVREFKNIEQLGHRAVNDYFEKMITNLDTENPDNAMNSALYGFMPSDCIEYFKKNPDKMADTNTIIHTPGMDIIMDVKHLSICPTICLINEITKHVAMQLINGTNNDKRTVYMMMCDSKKKFPISRSPDNIFSQRHINSAEFNPRFNKLNIFRSEEVLNKVLFHEFLHLSNWDRLIKHSVYPDFDTKWNINRSSGNLLLNESVVETMAQLLNIILVNHQDNTHDIKDMIETEIKFGLLQTAKILYLSGFTDVSDFLKPLNDKKVNESTSAVEYHVFKTILAINFNKFLKLYINKDVDGIKKLLTDYVMDSDYQKHIDRLINKFDDTYNDPMYQDVLETGRMSVIE